jgi:signal transduction histidine kinase
VHDDGRGFDVQATLAARERGLGLFGMQERAALVGGRLSITSQPNNGAMLTLTIPLPATGEDDHETAPHSAGR